MTKVSYKNIVLVNILFLTILLGVFYFVSHNEKQKKIFLPVLPSLSNNAYVSEFGPRKIIIPKIGVDAAIEPVGKAKSGNMAVPRSYDRVGWYKYGSVPGEVGNAVLAGHLDDGKGNPGVFFSINTLKAQDEVFVVGEDDEMKRFVVREIRVVDYSNAPLEEIFGEHEKPRLILITCDGTWIPQQKMYSERLIVFLEHEEKEVLKNL